MGGPAPRVVVPDLQAPAFRGGSGSPAPQRAPLRVSTPEDSAEREAVSAARQVMAMSTPPALAPGAGGVIQRQAAPAAAAPARIPAAGAGGGAPLPGSVRGFMEPRFGRDFGGVRIHTDARAATLSRNLAARAFTVGGDVYFGSGQYQPETAGGRELIAHELAHTVQQGAAPVPAAVVQRSADLTLTPQPPGLVQRLGLSDILDGLAELAANVPGFTLLTLIIGRNPINMRPVERNAVNLLRAFMGLIPGGEILFQVLERYGVVQRLGAWASAQAASLGLSFQAVRDAFTRFTDSLSWTDIFSPGAVWRRAVGIFTPLIDRVKGLVSGLASQAVTWLKETLMQPLSDFCREIPGYGLVTVLLGRDPFTNAPVPRTALNVVRAFAEFIPGGTEKVDQLVQSGALERAYAWFQQETAARNLTWARVAGTFASVWASLRVEDVLHPIDTLRRIVNQFRPLMSDLIGFAGAALMKLLELIYEAAMGAGGRRILAILMRARATFLVIIRDPVGFLRNLMGAVARGIRQFMGNILTHLREGVIAWLTGPVARAGIQMPERWDLRGIIWFVLQILGLTWARVREKLVRLLGATVVETLERGFELIQQIRERGLVQALRDRVTEFFGTLRDAALGSIRSFIQERLVMAGITQLLSLLNPVGAIIQAIIKTYTTVQFFIEKINQILDLVESVVNSIASIASGAIGSAASLVERTMARTIPVILDFLARFIGLGNVGAQVQRTIRNLQASVDRMLDRAVEWIRTQAQRLGRAVVQAGVPQDPNERLRAGMQAATAAVNRFAGRRVGRIALNGLLNVIRVRYGFASLEVLLEGGRWAVQGQVNPRRKEITQVYAEESAGANTLTADEIRELFMQTFSPAAEAESASQDRPEVTLSPSSLSFSRTILYRAIDISPATPEEKRRSKAWVDDKLAQAQADTDSHGIYVRMQQAAGIVNRLYGGDSVIQIHHEQEVGEHRATFAVTATARIRFPVPLQRQLETSITRIAERYEAMPSMSKEAKRRLANRDIQELTRLMRQSLADFRASRERDERGERTVQGTAAATEIVLTEIDLLAVGARDHTNLHVRRRRERSARNPT